MTEFILMLIVVLLVLSWTAVVPANHAGVETILEGRFFFGRTKMRVLAEGLQLRYLPWLLSQITLISLERDSNTFPVKTYTKYGEEKEKARESPLGETAEVEWNTTILWRPHRHPVLLRRYFELSREATDRRAEDTGLKIANEALKAIMGELVGQVTIVDIVDFREQLRLMLNVFARGSAENWVGTGVQSDPILKSEGCTNFCLKLAAERLKLLPEIRKLVSKIDKEDAEEDELTQEELAQKELVQLQVSEIEEKAGIQILGIFISEPKFSEETRRAIEARLRAAREAQGAEALVETLTKLAASMDASLPVKTRNRYAGMALGLPITETAIETSEGAPAPVFILQSPSPKGK